MFLEKGILKFAAFFLNTLSKNIYGGLGLKVILSSRKCNTAINKLNIVKIIAIDALKTFNK